MSTPAAPVPAPPSEREGVRPVGVALFVTGIALVALNLRTPLAVVPPLTSALEDDLGLSGPAVGLLTTLPVLCMGLFAPPAQRLAHAHGREATVALALLSLLAGTLLRVAGDLLALLYAGTLLVGVGIALIGTLLPGIVKDYAPRRAGLLTAVYLSAMMVGATAASALAVPLADAAGSWREALLLPVVLVVAGLVGWAPVLRGARRRLGGDRADAPRRRLPWSSPTARLLAAYLAAQSLLFYTELAWIAPTFVEEGSTDEAAGVHLAAFMASQLVASVGVPLLADRLRDRRPLLLGVVGLSVVGLAGLVLAPVGGGWAWMVLLGLGGGGGFALGLVHLADWADTPATSARLSGLGFLVSYCVGATGPTLFGALRDATGGVTAPWVALLALTAASVPLLLRMTPDRLVRATD
ncbi:MFS transporter [Vallicoccus soli]|uniref:MFS transporter n=1 Tax=Vallicoccus soli TaxID=2339232 RepID=A0A3A3ZKW4_9ACTN|nr:MFS transporter [Vallicoccus soli]RJK96726.1 MFS transporter [Vallicoccus soli]